MTPRTPPPTPHPPPNPPCLQAAKLCPSDPLVANELGVLAFRNRQYAVAADWLRAALALVPGGRPTPGATPCCALTCFELHAWARGRTSKHLKALHLLQAGS